ncbi:MAG: SurA N-terminal domain-containing protein [Bacteroidales bacterium]|nr:SurA N-terminal domain-containing protein [Bacteroidales bacterium]
MAAIGSIRKHGVALMIIIGLALLAFILGDLSQVTRTFSNKNIMAKVDGKKVDKEYSEQYEQNTALMRLLQNKSSFDENETYQIHEMTWRQMLQDKALDKQLAALGLSYTDQMIEDFKADMVASLSTQRPNQFMGQFANALAQLYGPENAMAIISNIEEYGKNDQTKDIYNAYQALVRFALSAEKSAHYFALAQNTLYFSAPLAKQLAKDNKTAMVSLMAINPETPAFKNITATVSDKEMKDFYKLHKDELFTVRERNCDMEVAVFPINPTAQDLKAIEDSVRADFAQFTSMAIDEYSNLKGDGAVDSTYYKAEDITLDALDSLIFKVPVGSNIEPFQYENVKWYFGKVYGGASRPDSVQVASIQLPYKTGQNANAKYSKKEAQALADSLKGVIAGNQASIFALQKTYMDATQLKDTTMWIPERGTIPDLYNNLIATANGGVYVYKAQGGYIVFQVLDRTAPIEKRQFVLYDYDIAASDATVASIKAKATEFAGSVTNADELVTLAGKKGVQVVKGVRVPSMASTIGQLPNCRDIISWGFSEEVKKNPISDVFNVERMYFAVAAMRTVRDYGTEKYKDVKSDIENQLKAEKKAEMVAQQINGSLSSSDMQTIAQQYSTMVADSVLLSYAGDNYMNRGVDSKAIGKIFTLPTNKPTAVNGKNMVYVVNVQQVSTPAQTPDLNMERNALRNVLVGRERGEMTILNYLMEQTKVMDNRCRFYQK